TSLTRPRFVPVLPRVQHHYCSPLRDRTLTGSEVPGTVSFGQNPDNVRVIFGAHFFTWESRVPGTVSFRNNGSRHPASPGTRLPGGSARRVDRCSGGLSNGQRAVLNHLEAG